MSINLNTKTVDELIEGFEKLVDMEVETEYKLSIIRGAKEKILFHIDQKVDEQPKRK